MFENIRRHSRGSIPPLRMPSLLPHDLCHEWNVSRWLLAANHFSILALRIPWTVWKGEERLNWTLLSAGRLEASVLKLWWGWISVADHSRYYTEQNLGHFTIFKKSINDKCWRGCGAKGTLHCCWECKLVQPEWKRVWRFLRKLKIDVSCEPAIPLLGIYLEKIKNVKSKRYVHPYVHSSIIYNRQDMETT